MPYSAELVTTETKDGLLLFGTLRRPEASRAREIGLDLVVMHHGIGGNFYRSAMFDQISASFLDAGCAVLRVNNRGSDLVANGSRVRGQPIRVGAALETVADCVLDYRAWNDFAESAGFRTVGMWGHSLGAVKTIYYLGTERDARVVCAIASSPPRFSFGAFLASPDGPEFQEQYERARALVEQGKVATLLEMTRPTAGVLTAATYTDKYGPPSRYDIVSHLPNVSVPMLVTLGALEPTGPQRISFAGHEAEVGGLTARHPHLAFEILPGADHFYTGREQALWLIVRAWIARVTESRQAAPVGSP